MKICKKCNEQKPITLFCNKSNEKDGRHRYCKECQKSDASVYYHSYGRKESEYYKEYRDKNKEYFNEYTKSYYQSNKELYRKWHKNKYHTDLGYKLRHVISSRISHALRFYNTIKQNRTIEYLGCSLNEYVIFLENKFDANMNWDNYGEYWEIDHIKPISLFDLTIEDNMYKCFNYINTQPLEKIENKIKSNKYKTK